jgi:hypothetical protein
VKFFRRARRRRKMTPFDESTLPDAAPATVEDATSEGLMLAEYASRMKVKNEIIVGVLTSRRPYDPSQYLPAATTVLEGLRTEFHDAAERIAQELHSIADLRGSARHAHDYRSGDSANLRHREEMLRALVTELRDRRDDDDYLLELIEAARKDAWSDISRAVEDNLDRSYIVVDKGYERERAKRMRQVADDLAKLTAASSR